MNKNNTNNNDNNNMININFLIQANLYPGLLSLVQKSDNFCIMHINIKKINYRLCLSSKVPTNDCFAYLLLGDSTLLLCCSESSPASRNP